MGERARPAAASPHRRQLLLFAAALLLPYAVLVALGFRVAVQDRELSRERTVQEQRQAARDAAADVLARLEEVRRGEDLAPLGPGGRYRRPETVFVGWVEDDRLTLPWEENQAARASRERLSRAPFSSSLSECERLEGRAGGLRQAAACYQQSAAAAADPLQSAWAGLLRARALDRAGDAGPAAAAYRGLLGTPPLLTDEDGVPLRLYAAQRLAPEDPGLAAGAAEAVVDRPWLPPLACYVASDAADKLEGPGAGDFRARVAAHVRLVEQAQSLQEQFSHRAPPAGGKVWTSFGDEMWLLASLPQPGGRPALLAVRAAEVLRPVEQRRGLRFVPVHESGGEALGEALPGLKAAVPALPGAPAGTGAAQRTLFYASLALLAAVMIFAAWLLWRDLRREVRLSEMRSGFVSSVSHELKTPLTAIRMLAETLQMGRGRDPETQEQYLDTIVHECERLSRLVDGVLLFSRIEQNRKVYRFRALDAAASVRAALRTMEHPLEQRGFRLSLDVEPDLPPVEADDDALQQAVLNLVGNAMKYSGAARGIEVGVARAGASVAIRVADHGIGIPAGELGRIWEKFYRADTPENRHIPGAGLGLALVAQIVKAHGGSVEVRSVPGEGSVFSLLLPVKETV